jgi:hypothetical protein
MEDTKKAGTVSKQPALMRLNPDGITFLGEFIAHIAASSAIDYFKIGYREDLMGATGLLQVTLVKIRKGASFTLEEQISTDMMKQARFSGSLVAETLEERFINDFETSRKFVS